MDSDVYKDYRPSADIRQHYIRVSDYRLLRNWLLLNNLLTVYLQ